MGLTPSLKKLNLSFLFIVSFFLQQLLSWDECQIILDKYCQDLELPNTAESLVNILKNCLSKTGEKVDFKYPQNATLIK